MNSQTIEKHHEILHLCEGIFDTGKYFPRTTDEAHLLRTLGFELQQGCLVLPTGIEYLDQAFIEQGLRTGDVPYHEQVLVNNCVGSTNKELLGLAIQHDISNTVMLAELQIAGCGRFGRAWQSPVGRNLALSMGARITRTLANPGTVSLVVGVAVAKVLEELGVKAVSLKWPNDILVEGQKVGGILVDVGHVSNPLELVIGIGLNVGGGSIIQKTIGQSVADLLDYSTYPIRSTLAVNNIRNVYESLQRFETDGFQSFHDNWTELDALKDQPVTVSTLQKSTNGIARGIRDTGELCVELENGKIHYVIAGEVSLQQPI